MIPSLTKIDKKTSGVMQQSLDEVQKEEEIPDEVRYDACLDIEEVILKYPDIAYNKEYSPTDVNLIVNTVGDFLLGVYDAMADVLQHTHSAKLAARSLEGKCSLEARRNGFFPNMGYQNRLKNNRVQDPQYSTGEVLSLDPTLTYPQDFEIANKYTCRGEFYYKNFETERVHYPDVFPDKV